MGLDESEKNTCNLGNQTSQILHNGYYHLSLCHRQVTQHKLDFKEENEEKKLLIQPVNTQMISQLMKRQDNRWT